MQQIRQYTWAVTLAILGFGIGGLLLVQPVHAQVTDERDVTVTATVLGAPPTTQAVILQPTDGEVFETTPLVVQGTCGADLLVRVFNNGDLAGTITCSSMGTFTMNITLVVGSNELTVLNYDAQDQAGPDSPAVTVTVVPPPVPPEDTTDTPGATDDTVISVDPSATEEVSLSTQESPDVEVPIFEGTFLEPVARLLSTEYLVSATIKTVFDAVLTAVFITVIFAPLLWGMFLLWSQFFK